MRVSGFSLLCGMKEKFNMTEFNEILALPNCQISPVYYVPQSKCWAFLLPPPPPAPPPTPYKTFHLESPGDPCEPWVLLIDNFQW